ncbi:MAG TPA: tRNA lysidine(34) synthetase TilS [Pyrinomonadaceae bacterium]|nr:tRNA lysidine(34) synthetase TilS [Pyrinomonadaceae bacterium]
MKSHRKQAGRAVARNAHRQQPISKFARALLREWRTLTLPLSDAVVVVGVSGGADSVGLFLALDELIKANKLNIRIVVAHLDHRLRKKSGDDARWVRELATRLGHEATIKRAPIKSLARRSGDNLEQAARLTRYKWFAEVAQKRGAELVLTAHTMDDQAETVLLNLLRGSGTDGMGGMEPVRLLNGAGKRMLARPLLAWAGRRDTEGLCRARGIDFRQDEMNVDEAFARVRVRRQLLPIMRSFNPRITEALARTAELLRDDSRALDSAAQRLLDLSTDTSAKLHQLRTDLLADVPPALRRRALRLWLEQRRGDLRRLELVHVRAVENLVTQNRGGRTIELPGGSTVSCKSGLLTFNRRTSKSRKALPPRLNGTPNRNKTAS